MLDGTHAFQLSRIETNPLFPVFRGNTPPSAAMSEVLKCFTFLAESAPTWIKSLEELEEKIKQRQAEVERIGRTPSEGLKRRTGSNESLRPSRDDTGNSSSVEQRTPTFSPYAVATTSVVDRNLSSASKRKRIAESIKSVTSASQKRYRIRNPILVYYDSEVQKGFENLVYSIGSGRNNIRKARLAIRMETLTNLSTGISGDEAIGGRIPSRTSRNAPSGYEVLLAQGLRSARGLETLRPDLAKTDGLCSTTVAAAMDPCTLADQTLDKAQAFCETGAYHFLREGECGEEVSGARKMFDTLKENCEKEVERLMVLERAGQTQKDAERVVEQDRQRIVRSEVGTSPALIQHDSFNATIEADDESDDEDDDYALLTLPCRTTARA